MARPVRWSRDLHALRERAFRARTETWSRLDVEQLFGVSRASSQSLMKAIGGVQVVGGAHFVERLALVAFLDEMIGAESVEEALRQRMAEAPPPPRSKPLRVSLPEDLRRAMLPDLPANISLSTGRLEIQATTAEGMLGPDARKPRRPGHGHAERSGPLPGGDRAARGCARSGR